MSLESVSQNLELTPRTTPFEHDIRSSDPSRELALRKASMTSEHLPSLVLTSSDNDSPGYDGYNKKANHFDDIRKALKEQDDRFQAHHCILDVWGEVDNRIANLEKLEKAPDHHQITPSEAKELKSLHEMKEMHKRNIHSYETHVESEVKRHGLGNLDHKSLTQEQISRTHESRCAVAGGVLLAIALAAYAAYQHDRQSQQHPSIKAPPNK